MCMSKKVKSEFMKAFMEYRDAFGGFITPSKEVCGNDEAAKSTIELIKKSIEDGYDYVAEKFNIDKEQQLKHYDVIYD